MTEQHNHRTEELFGFAEVVERLDAFVVCPPASLETELVPALAAASTSSRAGSVSGILMRAAAFAAGFVLVGGGLAAADALPAPLQEAAASVLRAVGVEVPGDPGGGGTGSDGVEDEAEERDDDEAPGDDDTRLPDDDDGESDEPDDDESDDESDDDESDDDELDDDDEPDDDEPDDDEPDDD